MTFQNMVPTNSYQDLISYLYNRLAFDSLRRIRQSNATSFAGRRLVGILFARPSLPLTKEVISPNLNYFHHRSGANVDFFCAGYEISTSKMNANPSYATWQFSDRAFNALRQRVEQHSQWRYSGEVDLI